MADLTKSDSTRRRQAAYSLAAGATAMLAGAEAEGQIVWSTTQNLAIDQGASQTLNLDGDTYDDILLKNYVFAAGNYQGLFVYFAPGRVAGFRAGPSNFGYASVLSAGSPINSTTVGSGVPAASLALGAANPNAQFNNVNGGYIGLQFPIGGDTYYGWIRVTIDNSAGVFVVRDWAYNRSSIPLLDSEGNPVLGSAGLPRRVGLPILAGQVAGDYNRDGVVDAADYTIYRDTLGSTTDLRADGDNDGVITALGAPDSEIDGDYFVWSQDYGFSGLAPGGPSSSAATAVPEPATLGLLACGAAGVGLLRRTRTRACQALFSNSPQPR